MTKKQIANKVKRIRKGEIEYLIQCATESDAYNDQFAAILSGLGINLNDDSLTNELIIEFASKLIKNRFKKLWI